MKAEDGENIKLIVLKHPILLDTLDVEYENENVAEIKKENKETKQKLKTSKVQYNTNDSKDMKKEELSLLKDPISLDTVNWKNENDEIQSSVTFNVKTVQRFVYKRTKKKNRNDDDETWKRNALILFEFSYVYPFIYAGNKYKCFVCLKPFLDATLLNQHSINEHNIRETKRELDNRVRDKTVKVDVTYLQCKLCSLVLTDLQTLKMHLKGSHDKNIDSNIEDNLIPFKLGGENVDCQVCGERFLKLRLLVIHMSKHFNNYSCEICGSMFISLHLLKRHLQSHETGSFPCEKCDKVFSNAAKRTLHTRGVHLKHYPRRCPICSERFNSNYQRTKHLRIVHNQTTGLYRCDTCGRQYDLKYHLLVHVRSVHLQERNQECPICHTRFFSKYCLSRHMITHTGEKNYKCNVCGRAYARRKNLREHSRTHEAGACSICGQNFEDQLQLIAHVNSSHTGM